MMFKSIDKDQDGHLDKAELRAAFIRAGLSVPNSRLDKFFEDVDSDDDGVISFDEWRYDETPLDIASIVLFSSFARAAHSSHSLARTTSHAIILNLLDCPTLLLFLLPTFPFSCLVQHGPLFFLITLNNPPSNTQHLADIALPLLATFSYSSRHRRPD